MLTLSLLLGVCIVDLGKKTQILVVTSFLVFFLGQR